MKQKYVLQRWPQTDDELWWWVLSTWGVRIPRHQVCPDHVAPFTAFADAYFARHSVCIWKASRGFGGKTHLLSILGMSELVSLGAHVAVLGGSGTQSQRVHETMKEAWEYEHSPAYLLSKEPTKYLTYLNNGGKADTLMASSRSVRGLHPSRLRLDEIDEMEMNILTSAQGMPMRKKGADGKLVDTNTVMSSTHQYPSGTMTKILDRAKESGWPVYQWCYKESSDLELGPDGKPMGWLLTEEIERKRTETTKQMWEAEYDLQEPSFEGRAIDEDALLKMFSTAIGTVDGAEGKYIEIYPPMNNRDYITGADWAKSRDYTIIWTFDATVEPWRMVAFERIHRRPWPAMISRLNKRLARYGGKVAHDETGIGSVVNDYIEIPKGVKPHDVKGIVMAGRARSDMITNYVTAIEQGLIVGPMITTAYTEHKYATPDDLYNGSSTSHLPDTIAAGALAWSLRNTWKRVAAPVHSLSRAKSPWKI